MVDESLGFDGTSKSSAVYMIVFSIAKATIAWCGSVSVYLVYRYLKWWFSPLWKQNIPGPKTNYFLLGEFAQIRREPFMQPQLGWIKTITGWNVPMVHYSIMFGRHTLLILDKSIVKEILTAPYGGKEPLRFRKDVGNIRNVLGDGLVTAEGDRWMRHRQIIQPAFFTQAIKDALNTHVPRLTLEFVECWKKAHGREIELSSHISSLTLDIIGQVAFSHQFRALKSVEQWAKDDGSDSKLGKIDDPFIQAMGAALNPTIIGLISLVLGIPAIAKYLNPKTLRVRRAMNYHVDLVLSNARRQLKNETTKGKGNKSLLSLLLEAAQGESKRTLDNTELNDEIKTFIFAGHETTSTWCNMGIFAFTQHPRVQNIVYEDVVRHAPPSTALTLEVVEKMEYLNAFLQEVLRMYPPGKFYVTLASTMATTSSSIFVKLIIWVLYLCSGSNCSIPRPNGDHCWNFCSTKDSPVDIALSSSSSSQVLG
jgi:cytochrome P450